MQQVWLGSKAGVRWPPIVLRQPLETVAHGQPRLLLSAIHSCSKQDLLRKSASSLVPQNSKAEPRNLDSALLPALRIKPFVAAYPR